MGIKELEQRINQLLQEAKPLALKSKDGGLTDEESARFDELVENINKAGEDLTEARNRAAQGDRVLGTLEELTKGTGSAARHVPNGQEGRAVEPKSERRDFRNPGKRFVASESFKRYASSPNGTSARELLGSTYFKNDGADVDHREGQGPTDFRDLVYTGSFTDYLSPTRLPGIVSGTPFPLRVRDVLTNGRTDSPTVEFVRKLSSTNNAAEVAEATTTAGATAKPESAIDLEVVSTSVKTIAHWIPVTRQMLQDAASIQTFIEADLLYGLEQREDAQILDGDGTGANLTGILNTSGIQYLDNTATTGYWATNPLPADANELDRIRHAVKKVRVTGEAFPNFVIAHPDDVEVWDTLKDADGNYLLRSGGPEAGGVRSIWGLTIVESTAITARETLVGDGRYGIVLDKQDGQIFMTDSHSDWFTKNLIAILAESRLALAVTLPAAFAHVELPAL